MFLSFGEQSFCGWKREEEEGREEGVISKNKAENKKPGVKYSGSVRIYWLFEELKESQKDWCYIPNPY